MAQQNKGELSGRKKILSVLIKYFWFSSRYETKKKKTESFKRKKNVDGCHSRGPSRSSFLMLCLAVKTHFINASPSRFKLDALLALLQPNELAVIKV